MLSQATYRRRREQLRKLLPEGIVVLGGHRQLPLNLPMNLTPPRQGSQILYLTGLQEAQAAILFRLDTGRLEIFAPPHEPGDDIWHGESPTVDALAAALGADAGFPLDQLEGRIAHHRKDGAPVYSLPSSDPDWSARMAAIGVDVPRFGALDRFAPSPLADAMVQLRLVQDAEALEEMRAAAAVTVQAHRAAMAATRAGGHEAQIRGLIEAIFMASGTRPSYSPIVTVRGEILHCRANPFVLKADDLLLVDAGCETAEGYASDVTRTWPVRGTFDARQKAVYEIVLEAQMQCIDRVRPGVEYESIHMHACRVIAQGLKDLHILRGDVDDLVANDAHALFFPHGIGHLIGLDVHDIEDLGDRAGYQDGKQRSNRFGLAYLRLNRRLEPGMAVTIEPGIYFIPGLLRSRQIADRYGKWIDFDEARNYLGFGGIRIEDDVVVTTGAPEVLTGALEKSVADVEALTGSAPDVLGAIARFRPAA